MSPELWFALGISILQTIEMIIFSTFFAFIIGLPMGIGLFLCRPGSLSHCPWLYRLLAFIVNIVRSIPFIILLVLLIPFTRLLIGTSIGTTAAIVPLSIGAAPFIARLVDNALQEIPFGLIEAGISMGMNRWQIVTRVLLPESYSGIVNGLTLTVVALIGYTAMAGAVGGGGLGDLAIQYGYNMFNTTLMLITVVVLIVMVQATQWIGELLAKRRV
ncbi:MAG: ABC transporter permease [Legionellales bacterium]|nr:ABC transporter permease [Legionellales bacterium]